MVVALLILIVFILLFGADTTIGLAKSTLKVALFIIAVFIVLLIAYQD